MILTTKEKVHAYAALNPYFEKAFAVLKEVAAEDFVKGRHPVDDNIYINAAEYQTHPAEGALAEAHRVYIDVMWMLSGNEQIGVVPVEKLTEITKEYAEAGDALLAKLPENYTALRMTPDSVCILFPEDGHAPGLIAGEQEGVRKLICKVRVV